MASHSSPFMQPPPFGFAAPSNGNQSLADPGLLAPSLGSASGAGAGAGQSSYGGEIWLHWCTLPGCKQRFSRPSDLQRHLKAVHLKTDIFWCSADGCDRSLAPSGNVKPFPRKDKRDEHFLKVHLLKSKVHPSVKVDHSGFDTYAASLVAASAGTSTDSSMQHHAGFATDVDEGFQMTALAEMSLGDALTTYGNDVALPQNMGNQVAFVQTGLNNNMPTYGNGNGYFAPPLINNASFQGFNTHTPAFPGAGTGEYQNFNSNQVNTFPAQGVLGFGVNAAENKWAPQTMGNLPSEAEGMYGPHFNNGAGFENNGNGEQWNVGNEEQWNNEYGFNNGYGFNGGN